MTMTNQPKTAAWPLLFTYRGPVIGNGFLAHVDLCGKLLASLETEGVWLDGVNPGGFAVGARTLDEANRELRDALTRVFIDFVQTAQSFDSFKAAVEQFYAECDADTMAEWKNAVAAIQEGTLPVPDGLPRKPAEWECKVHVTKKALDELTANDNADIPNDEVGPGFAAAA